MSEPLYLKQAPWRAPAVAKAVCARVSDLLLAIERGGEPAVRRVSFELDGWSPPRFVVDAEDIRRASRTVSAELAGHIAFAQEQVRGFARAQLGTLSELDAGSLTGCSLKLDGGWTAQ